MIEIIKCRKVATTRARMLTQEDYDARGGVIQTLEGPATFQVGDYLCIGIHGEEWPQRCSTFEANNEYVGLSSKDGYGEYRSITSCIAFQLPERFIVKRGTGDPLIGQPGDYLLVRGVSSWPVARSIFEESYERIA